MTATIQAALANRRPALPCTNNPLTGPKRARNQSRFRSEQTREYGQRGEGEAKVAAVIFDSLFWYLFFMQAAAKARVVAEEQPSQTHTAKEQ